MYLTEALVDFVESCAAREPTPGGGAVSALVGALGASMGEMAAVFSDKDEKAAACLDELRQVREALLPLVESDCEVYEKMRQVLALPKKTLEEKRRRRELLQRACKGALGVPLQGARLCVEGLGVLDAGLAGMNRNLISDVGCAALFFASSFRGLMYNVIINLSYIDEEDFVARIRVECRDLGSRVEILESKILEKVDEQLPT